MDTAPELAGFSATRLARIDQHLLDNYVEPQKIAGCQVAVARRGHVAGRPEDRQHDPPRR